MQAIVYSTRHGKVFVNLGWETEEEVAARIQRAEAQLGPWVLQHSRRVCGKDEWGQCATARLIGLASLEELLHLVQEVGDIIVRKGGGFEPEEGHDAAPWEIEIYNALRE
jgi:hypothetical protein